VKSRGAFTKCDNGTWMIDTQVKVDNEWKHFKKKGFATLSAAQSAFDTERELFIKKHSKHHEVMLFDDLLDKYREMRRVVVDESTLVCDQSVYNVYLLPYFSKKLIKDCLNRDAINEWYHNLVDTPKYSNNKKSKVITRMKDLLKFAYMHEYIDAPTYQSCDVCLYQVKYKKRPDTERVVWSKEEETDFFDAVDGDKHDYLMFRLFFTCSPRLGEFLGLTGDSFDYKKKKLTIKQQVKNVVGKGAVLTDKLKTHESYRTIVLDRELADMLNEYINTFSIKADDFIFHSGKNKKQPVSRNTFRRKLYHYCELAGVRKINPHASRHISACKLARVATSAELIEAAARRLGHSPEMFLNTYARHVDDEKENELLRRLDA